jgi:hypothetical protein
MRQKPPLTRTAPMMIAVIACLLVLLLWGAPPARADGFRTITTVRGDYFFPNPEIAGSTESYYLETDEVLLVRILPALTLEARITRDDFPGGPQHIFFLGPVINFTETIYAVAVYGLGIDSGNNLIHELNTNFNWETDTSAAFVGLKADYFASDGSWYVLPSLGGKFHLLPPLSLFGEFFMSFDSSSMITGAFWGEAGYTVGPVVAVLAGFTVSFARNLGYSIIAGTDITITENIKLKYKFSFLSQVVEYLTQPQPTTSYGIENLLSLDWKF